MPQPSDYNDAVQALKARFRDPTIKEGSIAERDIHGIPAAYSGNFACVYKIRAAGGMWAIRFFLHTNSELVKRYSAIKQFLIANPCPFFVDFDFQENAVLIQGGWYPLLKMPWVDGRTLDKFVKDNLPNSKALMLLAEEFAQVIATMRAKGIAHGDLQHGNIIVSLAGLKLIDYDGLFCPSTKHMPSTEIGMPNYQHPRRKSSNIGPNIDDFSAWIIYLSLRLLSKDQVLFNDNDALIFEKSDYESPGNSVRLNAISNHRDPEIRAIAGFIIKSLLGGEVANIPTFDPRTNFTTGGARHLPFVAWWKDSQNKTPRPSTHPGDSWISDWVKKSLAIAFSVLVALFLLGKNWGLVPEGVVIVLCAARNTYLVKTINLNLRESPGKYLGNRVLAVLPERTNICVIGDEVLVDQSKGKKLPWVKVRVIGGNGLKGWVNRCLIGQKYNEGELHEYCL